MITIHVTNEEAALLSKALQSYIVDVNTGLVPQEQSILEKINSEVNSMKYLKENIDELLDRGGEVYN